jgi:hypothetical protein
VKPVYIYALGDPDTCAIRYIGKSIRPEQRLQNHMNDVSNCHRSHWLQELKAQGKLPLMVIIECIYGDMPWQPEEKFWIAHGRSMGWPLTNNTDGGDGVHGLPESTRMKMANTWVGRKHSDETRMKLSVLGSMRRHTEITKKRMSAAHAGRKITWTDKVAESLRKFSDDQVSAIRNRLLAGEGTLALAEEFGVHRTTISKIKMGKYYGNH